MWNFTGDEILNYILQFITLGSMLLDQVVIILSISFSFLLIAAFISFFPSVLVRASFPPRTMLGPLICCTRMHAFSSMADPSACKNSIAIFIWCAYKWRGEPFSRENIQGGAANQAPRIHH